jgi:hypothetical protein
MKKILAASAAVAALTFWPVAAAAQENATNTALGALSGAVVFGPVGAVAGAAIGYTMGPSIKRAWTERGSKPPPPQRIKTARPAAEPRGRATATRPPAPVRSAAKQVAEPAPVREAKPAEQGAPQPAAQLAPQPAAQPAVQSGGGGGAVPPAQSLE